MQIGEYLINQHPQNIREQLIYDWLYDLVEYGKSFPECPKRRGHLRAYCSGVDDFKREESYKTQAFSLAMAAEALTLLSEEDMRLMQHFNDQVGQKLRERGLVPRSWVTLAQALKSA